MANRGPSDDPARAESSATTVLQLIFAWTFVSLPLAWGVYSTLKKAAQLFQ